MKSNKISNGCLLSLTLLFIIIFSCSKQEIPKKDIDFRDSVISQINFLARVKNALKDSLNISDFSTVDFDKLYKSEDVRSKNYFVRLSFKNKKTWDDFILLKTDSTGNMLKGKIVKINFDESKKGIAKITVIASSLNRKTVRFLTNNSAKSSDKSADVNAQKSKFVTAGNKSSLMEEEPAGEQTLPDVVVTDYIDDDNTYWYCFDDILDYSGGGGGSTYTYGSSAPGGCGGSGVTSPDETINVTFESNGQPQIDIAKYIKCFSTLSNTGATFKITIYSDIPVNNDPNELFSFTTGDCGHTFLQLSKSNGSTVVQQNIGFYPQIGWKSLANSPTPSKIVDNAGHAFNASLTITVDATHFQNALNEMQNESTEKYDIDDFNCTNFALSVFNVAAPQSLIIPQMHIPNGTFGTESDTPQGLYIELSALQKSGGYPNGQISIPSTEAYAGTSHGACN